MTTLIRASFLHSVAPQQVESIPAGVMEIDEAGTIRAIDPSPDLPHQRLRDARVIDLRGHLVLPGFVDAHLHIPQIDVIGIASEKLIDWLNRYIFEEELANEDPDIARDRARRTFATLLRSGTTACAAFSSRHTEATAIAFEEAERAGIRAVIGKVLMDREAPSGLLEEATPALEGTEALLRQYGRREAQRDRLDVAVTPRFGVSCSDELLEGAGKLARKYGAPVQTHLSENKTELALIASMFPDRADYTDVYDHAGLLHERTILAHCIHLSDDEITRLAHHSCSSVYCPDSNFFLHSGRFPLHRAREKGLNVALGSDIGAGTSFSLLETMKMGNYMQTDRVDPRLLFYMGTLGGAKALGWEDRIGNFAPGKAADLVVLDMAEALPGRSTIEALEQSSSEELLSRLIHRGHRAQVREVFVQGEMVALDSLD